MNKKVIKLINNERTNLRIRSAKATNHSCDLTGNVDICDSLDYADCSLGSTDLCVKDYAGCTNGSFDYCGNAGGKDYSACFSGHTDTL